MYSLPIGITFMFQTWSCWNIVEPQQDASWDFCKQSRLIRPSIMSIIHAWAKIQDTEYYICSEGYVFFAISVHDFNAMLKSPNTFSQDPGITVYFP